MNRREWLGQMVALAGGIVSRPVSAISRSAAQSRPADQKIEKLEKSKSEWRKLLSREQYRVLFEEGTEPAFSSSLDKEKRAGTYICAACYLPLFSSKAKFDSGTGWPSFTEPIAGRVDTKR